MLCTPRLRPSLLSAARNLHGRGAAGPPGHLVPPEGPDGRADERGGDSGNLCQSVPGAFVAKGAELGGDPAGVLRGAGVGLRAAAFPRMGRSFSSLAPNLSSKDPEYWPGKCRVRGHLHRPEFVRVGDEGGPAGRGRRIRGPDGRGQGDPGRLQRCSCVVPLGLGEPASGRSVSPRKGSSSVPGSGSHIRLVGGVAPVDVCSPCRPCLRGQGRPARAS